jgi:8-oxo-dGTP diphosphatase
MKREYPDHPLVGVGGVVIHRKRVLLIRRGSEPLKGEWSIPGGMLELGEELPAGVRRELKEETGLEVEPLEVIAVFDRVIYGEGSGNSAALRQEVEESVPVISQRRQRPPVGANTRRVRYHYVIVDYACRWKRGRLAPASDVVEAQWVRREDLPLYHLTDKATSVIRAAFRFFESLK